MKNEQIILQQTLSYYGITHAELKTPSLKKQDVNRRFVFVNLCHRILHLSEAAISEYLEQTGKGALYHHIKKFEQAEKEKKKKGVYSIKDDQRMSEYYELKELILPLIREKKANSLSVVPETENAHFSPTLKKEIDEILKTRYNNLNEDRRDKVIHQERLLRAHAGEEKFLDYLNKTSEFIDSVSLSGSFDLSPNPLPEPKEKPSEAKYVDETTINTIKGVLDWFECPHCGENTVSKGDNYCPSCGGGLKWL